MRIERNAPCPCRSGKKFKKCCWLILEDTRRVPRFFWDVDGLSNEALEHIQEKRWAEAEAACRTLRKECPDQIDWLDRSAALEEARGRYDEAAAYYRKAAVFASQMPGFDDAAVRYFWDEAARVQQVVSSPS